MTHKSLLRQCQDIEMARNFCLLAGNDPDEMVAGYFVDAAGQRQRVSKARWRWYQDVAQRPDEQDAGPTVTQERLVVPEWLREGPRAPRERGKWMNEIF